MATVFLRLASLLTLLHCIGHTIGGVLSKPKGAEQLAVVETMKAHQFNVMGSMRSFWDFNFGYGLMTTITLLAQTILFWQLSTLVKTNPALARPIIALFFFTFAAMSVVAWRYFFVAPMVGEILIAICLAVAFAAAAS
jgi:hypothetical protein